LDRVGTDFSGPSQRRAGIADAIHERDRRQIADRKEAGINAAERLRQRAIAEGVDAVILLPVQGDFNEDLLRIDRDAMAASVAAQRHPRDRAALCSDR